jgi:membrane protein YqaA with SNARE-associated domain
MALAGAGNIPFGRFSVWVVLRKAARYLVVAWAALLVG